MGEDWVAEEAESNSETNELDDPIARCKWYNGRDECENARKSQPRCDQEKWWCGRKQAVDR